MTYMRYTGQVVDRFLGLPIEEQTAVTVFVSGCVLLTGGYALMIACLMLSLDYLIDDVLGIRIGVLIRDSERRNWPYPTLPSSVAIHISRATRRRRERP